MREVERSIVGEATSVEDGKQRLEDTIDRVVDDIETAKGEAAANATERIEDGDTLLVHDYSTTVLEAIENAARDGAHLTVYVTEARARTLGRSEDGPRAPASHGSTPGWWSIARWGTPSATATRSSSGSRV